MRLKSEKYSIAWFKLAELVTRKEKERALGLYRLLFHALEDKGLGYQLEGDLLFAFSDKKVIKSYYKAAALYERNMKFTQAAALYETLHALAPENIEYSIKLLDLHKQINNPKKIDEALRSLLFSYMLNEYWVQIDSLFNKEINSEKHQKFYSYICFSLLDNKLNKDKLNYYLNKVLKLYLDNNNNNKLQNFMLKLKSKDEAAHKLAFKILEKEKL